MRLTVLAFLTFAGAAEAASCDQNRLEALTRVAMSTSEARRNEGYGALEACFKEMMRTNKAGQTIQEADFAYMATLAGRLAAASQAANEPPRTTGIVTVLLRSHFDAFYYYLHAQPLGENMAVMRAMIHDTETPITGSIKQ